MYFANRDIPPRENDHLRECVVVVKWLAGNLEAAVSVLEFAFD